jgi:hypothetical protein
MSCLPEAAIAVEFRLSSWVGAERQRAQWRFRSDFCTLHSQQSGGPAKKLNNAIRARRPLSGAETGLKALRARARDYSSRASIRTAAISAGSLPLFTQA